MKEARRPFRFRLDTHSGVPVYRQIIDQVMGGLASGALAPGDRLPTMRQLAVDLRINPNTVIRAYREMEIRGVLETQQGSGTFIAQGKVKPDELERHRRLNQIVSDVVARVGAAGFSLQELLEQLNELQAESENQKRK
jgi:DNA-binding transcriptional regulator YhcF (GntR family)